LIHWVVSQGDRGHDERRARFFDVDERQVELSVKGNDLSGSTRSSTSNCFAQRWRRRFRAKGGQLSFDHVLMFEVLILQAMHSLSDER
jgi:hypothetical protein